MGYATIAVLQALANGRQYGFDIVDHTGLASGTVYPALSSLEGRGYVEPNWEDDDVARADGRPPRKLYKVTKEGRAALREAVKRLGALGLGVAPMAAKRAR
jgi:DNA-binding PadR family transcriptional regulator